MIERDKLFAFHYNFVEAENKCYCRHCDKKFEGRNASNLKRHLLDAHETNARDTDIKINPRKRPASDNNATKPAKFKKLNNEDIIKICVGFVTENLVPYNFFSFGSMKSLIEGTGCNLSVSPRQAKYYVDNSAQEIKKMIADEMKNKLLSLKIDVASRMGRSILGVNIQYYSIKENKMIIRTIGMTEINKKHTAANINSIVSQILQEYQIDKRQICSITCDNGANVIASVKEFQDRQASLLLMDELDELVMENDDDDVDLDAENFDESGPSDVPQSIKDALNDISSIAVLLRCSAHTLQLCVHDTLKEIKRDFNMELENVRKVVKNLKLSTYAEGVKELKIKIPNIDVCTRWNSSYVMVHKLINIRSQLERLYEYYADMNELSSIMLSESEWKFIEKFHDAFYPCYNLTMKLQSSSLAMADFFFLWKKCLFDLRQMGTENDFANILYGKMNARTDKILDKNDVILSALYVDPRYNFVGKIWKPELKARAEAYLLKILKQVTSHQHSDAAGPEWQNSGKTAQSDFDLFMDEEETVEIGAAEMNEDMRLLDSIRKCCSQSRIFASNEGFNVFQYLQAKYSRDKLLLEAFLSVAAAPCTQTSVERAFSSLRILLSHLRYNLTSTSLENILICRLNPDVLKKIDMKKLFNI